jgi:DNA-binding beta-propeller fold protein YncE
VGSFPYGLGFDGANVWVANGEGTVTKLRACDGKHLGTFKAGGGAIGVAFDGTNVWVINGLSDTVSKF